MTRYLSGLSVAGLGLCGGGWLIVAAVAFGGGSPAPAERVNLLTGAGLVVVSGLSLLCWATAWRRRMRGDGVLADRFRFVSRREARRNRRKLSRDVGRTARLAKRSAREGRRSSRRASRRAGRGGVLSSGAGLGPAAGGGGPYSVAVVPAEAGDSSGESAVELLSELRAMLMPLLTAAGERPLGEPTAGGPLAAAPAPDPLSAAPVADPLSAVPAASLSSVSDVPGFPGSPVASSAVVPRQLPRRIPRPASVPGPPAVPAARPPADGDDPRFAADGEEAWW